MLGVLCVVFAVDVNDNDSEVIFNINEDECVAVAERRGPKRRLLGDRIKQALRLDRTCAYAGGP